MSDTTKAWFHSNRYSAQEECCHCGGIIRHEPWCINIDPNVAYAYEVIAEPDKLSLGDALILRSLGVLWDAK
jgi:hypothetical protein